MRVRWRTASWVGAALAGLSIACGSAPRDEGPAATAALPVHVETAIAASSLAGLVVSGVVHASSARTLAFSVSGRIDRILVEGGAWVERGDPIAELRRGELSSAVAAARAASDRAAALLGEAERRNRRRRGLLDLAAVAGPPLAADDIALALHAAEVRQARAALERAEERLAAAVLVAPSTGVVGRRYRAPGADVAAGVPVLSLIEIDRVIVRSAVPRALASLAPDGGAAVVRLVGDSGTVLQGGPIRRTAVASAATGGPVAFELSVTNPDHVLRPQMVVDVAVALEPIQAQFTIPLSSVRPGIGDEPFAFVVIGRDEAPRVERRALRLGGLRRDRVAVVSGLRAGDRVVSRGADLLTVGDVVDVVGEGP